MFKKLKFFVLTASLVFTAPAFSKQLTQEEALALEQVCAEMEAHFKALEQLKEENPQAYDELMKTMEAIANGELSEEEIRALLS